MSKKVGLTASLRGRSLNFENFINEQSAKIEVPMRSTWNFRTLSMNNHTQECHVPEFFVHALMQPNSG